jgi:hypothetical protein
VTSSDPRLRQDSVVAVKAGDDLELELLVRTLRSLVTPHVREDHEGSLGVAPSVANGEAGQRVVAEVEHRNERSPAGFRLNPALV